MSTESKTSAGHPVEWDASTYHRVSEPQFVWGMRVLDRLALAGDETVLDAGCGSGRLTSELLARLPRGRVIAVDRSSNMLDEARRTLAPYGERASFLCADLEGLTVDEPVDVVFSTATFHWVPNHERLFQHLLACLVPGGRLHAQCGGGANLARIHERAEHLLHGAPFTERFAGFLEPWNFQTENATRALLEHVGFTNIHTDLELAPTLMANAGDYAEFLRTVILRAHLAKLGDRELEQTFLTRMTELAASDEPAYSLDYVRLNMTAVRPG